jgi:uncharacterized lipoprotein YddW (UPF0748 family)
MSMRYPSLFFRIWVLLLLGGLLFACSGSKQILENKTSTDTKGTLSEFRAAWIASVANINWPSKPGLCSGEQKREAIALLDLLDTCHFNAVILQVRPQCDALYKSALEPWSYYLSGDQGKGPDTNYDPLEFWIEEAHRRGLELHAWVNPYRAHHPSMGAVSENSMVKQKPDWVLELTTGYWWLDPGLEDARNHSMAVILDIVKRYDIDGIHMDDYFYPYPSYNEERDFPDHVSYTAYRQKGGKLNRADWRRENVNVFIKRLNRQINRVKPQVKFGISPFGIWRPNHPPTIQGFDQYDQLYADAKLWLNKGWVDYFTPQLYWPIGQIPQSYPVLLAWWQNENKKGKFVWPGMRIPSDTTEVKTQEVIHQIMINRALLQPAPGHVFWSIGPLIKNPALRRSLLEGPFKQRALVPKSGNKRKFYRKERQVSR